MALADSRMRAGAAATLAAVVLGSPALSTPASAADGAASCTALEQSFLSAEAAGASDARTIRLSDGREARLAGIAGSVESEGSASLNALVAGRRISLHGTRDATDRYGRLLAQVTIENDPSRWVQGALVASGDARVAPGTVADCAKALLLHEDRARASKLGIWRERTVRAATDVRTLLAEAGHYSVVEGRVLRVGETGGRLVLDFGRRYDRDFSIVIPREAQRGFADAGVDLRALSGKRVRARGVLFTWGGPALELRVPAALELIGADEA
jgi:endonuclease YncB( thermonuclease family)